MALSTEQTTWLLALAALALVGYVVRLNVRARKASPVAAEAAAPAGMVEPPDVSRFVARFVQDADGQTLGETVSVEGDKVIMKAGSAYRALPLDALEARGDGLVVAKQIDWDEAERLGEAWKSKSFKLISYSPEELPPDER